MSAQHDLPTLADSVTVTESIPPEAEHIECAALDDKVDHVPLCFSYIRASEDMISIPTESEGMEDDAKHLDEGGARCVVQQLVFADTLLPDDDANEVATPAMPCCELRKPRKKVRNRTTVTVGTETFNEEQVTKESKPNYKMRKTHIQKAITVTTVTTIESEESDAS